jgi:hypothetical protein
MKQKSLAEMVCELAAAQDVKAAQQLALQESVSSHQTITHGFVNKHAMREEYLLRDKSVVRCSQDRQSWSTTKPLA